MKKVLLTTALGCAFMTSAFAQQADEQLNNSFGFAVEDYISMIPNGNGWPNDAIGAQYTFNQNGSFNMDQAGQTSQNTFHVTASRSWKVTFAAENFQYVNPQTGVPTTPPQGIDAEFPASDAFQVGTSASTDPGFDDVTPNNTFIFATDQPQNIVTGKGGKMLPFVMTTQVNLANAMSQYDLQGQYNTTIHMVASLD